MRRLYLLTIGLLLVAAGLCAIAAKKPERVIDRVSRVAVKLTYQDGTCSGTIIGPHAILSAEHCHVIGNPLKLNGRFVTVQSDMRDGQDHIIYIVAETFPEWAARAPLPQLGEPVFLIGNPLSLEHIFRAGTFSGEAEGRILFDLNTWLGDSGAGIFNNHGQLVAVSSQVLTSDYFKIAGSLPLQFTPQQWARAAQ